MPGLPLQNVPAIDESKWILGTIVRIFSLLSMYTIQSEEVKELLYPTAVEDGEEYICFDVKDG